MKYVILLTLAACMLGCGSSSNSGQQANLLPFLNADFSNGGALYTSQSQQTASLQYKVETLFSSMLESVANASTPSVTLHLLSQLGQGGNTVSFTAAGVDSIYGGVAPGNTVAFVAITNVTGVYAYEGAKATLTQCNTVFIQKSNSATQCLARLIVLAPQTARNIESDASGRYLVYLDYASNLYRYDTSTGVETLLDQNVEEFAVNSDGDVLATENFTNPYLSTNSAVYSLATGGIVWRAYNSGNTIPAIGSVTTINGTHGSQHFYFAANPFGDAIDNCTVSGATFCELIKTGTGVTATWAVQPATDYPVPYCRASANSCYIGWALAEDYLVQVTTGQASFITNNGVQALVSGGVPASTITGSLPNTVQALNSGSASIIVQAADVTNHTGLYRFNTGSNLFDTLMPAGTFTINAYDVDASGNTTVTATRVSDGVNVVATIANGSTVVNIATTTTGAGSAMTVLK